MEPAEALAVMRRQVPLVHCITNYVAMNVTANALLAAGASPAMVHAETESGEFAAMASALTINIGTLSPPWVSGMTAAIAGAKAYGRPWVLDPVAHFATRYRAKVARQLLELEPAILRGNASEIIALAGGAPAGKGVDAWDTVAAAERGARDVAKAQACVVVVTGPIDFVTDGARAARVAGGSPLMPRVTALGCALTGLLGAYAAVAPPMEASVAALCHFATAGEKAEALADGPGTFAPRFIDALAATSPEDLRDPARVAWG